MSEIGLLRTRGLSEVPDRSRPSSESARQAFEAYRSALIDYEAIVKTIQAHVGTVDRIEVFAYLYQHLEAAYRKAASVRASAAALASYPKAFVRLDSGAAFYSDIAAAADEAYSERVEQLTGLERVLATESQSRGSEFRLRAHEGFKGGHLIAEHVRKTIADARARATKQGKRFISSFFDEALANTVVDRSIKLDIDRVKSAREGEKLYIAIREPMHIGWLWTRSDRLRLVKSGHIIVIKDSSHSDGFRVVTVELE